MFKAIIQRYRSFVVWLDHLANVVPNEACHVAAVEALKAEHAAAVEALKVEHSQGMQSLREELTGVKESLKGELTALDAWALAEISRKFGPETRRRAKTVTVTA